MEEVDLSTIPYEVGLILRKCKSGIIYSIDIGEKVRYSEGYIEAVVELPNGAGCFCGGIDLEAIAEVNSILAPWGYAIIREEVVDEGWLPLHNERVLIYASCGN